MNPLVTVGIPTFNRPRLLARALRAVARQDYVDLEVLVADNATPGEDTSRVVDSFAGSMPNLRYVKHQSDIGSVRNFMHLLQAARGEYFMWLADDDEISPNYVSALVALLERNPDASSAAGHWMLMQNEHEGRLMPTSHYPQTRPFARALRFIWGSDDAFFYALHRTAVLRLARVRGYWWPNRSVLLNWAYVFLLDLVLRGRVLIAEDASVRFINHDYTQKDYAASRSRLAGALRHVCRRINVHYLYWEKCARLLHPVYLPIVVLASLVSLAREGGAVAIRHARRSVQSQVLW